MNRRRLGRPRTRTARGVSLETRGSARRVEFPTPLRRLGRVAYIAVAAALLALVAIAGWVGVRGASAYEHLEQVRHDVAGISGGSTDALSSARAVLAGSSEDARAARDLTSDPVWSVAEGMPWIGPQLAAFRTVADAADRIVNGSVLPLLSITDTDVLEGLTPRDGHFDVQRIAELAGPAADASEAAGEASAMVAAIDRTSLVGRMQIAVDEVDESARTVAATLDALSRTTQLLPRMLGQEGSRRYLVLVQNNAEWRSLGGITGTVLQLDAADGSLTLAGSTSAAALSKRISDPLVALPDDLQSVYSTLPVKYFQNVTQVPDFVVVGGLAKEMYARATGVDVDGVISIDPVVLSYVLEATGSVATSDGGELTSANAAKTLMSDVYGRFANPADQDEFFADAAGAVFASVFQGGRASGALLGALSRGAEERRVLMWSADDDEQRVIDGTSLAGNLPASDGNVARFGVYLNDATGSKMSYHVAPTVSLSWAGCPTQPTGTGEVGMTVQLRNTAPLDASTSLPPYVTGNGRFGVVPGSASTVVNVYLPEGWALVPEGMPAGKEYSLATVEDRQVITWGSQLEPQGAESISLTARATTSASVAEALVTPTADASLSPLVHSACAASNGGVLQ